MLCVRVALFVLFSLASSLSLLAEDKAGPQPSLSPNPKVIPQLARPPGRKTRKASLKYLYEDRKITASGHETTDTDPGIATSKGDFSLENYILSTNHYQIELLTNLDQAPESGALVIVSFPKPKGGSGFHARVFAI